MTEWFTQVLTMNLGIHGIILMWSGNNKVDGLLFHVQSQRDLAWDPDSHGADGFNGMGSSEWSQMVVDGADTVHIQVKADLVIPRHWSCAGSDLGVEGGNGSYTANGGNGDTHLVRLFSGDSSDEHHANQFLVVGSRFHFSEFLHQLWDGGDGFLVSGVVCNNTVVEHDGDFNAEWLRLTFLDSNLGEDFLDLVEINDTSGHTHDSGGKRFAKTFHTHENGKIFAAVSSGLSIESDVDSSWEKRASALWGCRNKS